MEATSHVLHCANCDSPLENVQGRADAGCPKCGSTSVVHKVVVTDVVDLTLFEELRAKQRDPSFPSKQNPRKETLVAHGKDRTGRNVVKRRIADKATNSYLEHVQDKETGEVIHHCEEPLTEHRGHGSAKGKVHDA